MRIHMWRQVSKVMASHHRIHWLAYLPAAIMVVGSRHDCTGTAFSYADGDNSHAVSCDADYHVHDRLTWLPT